MEAVRRWAASKKKARWYWQNPKKRGKPGEAGFWEEYDKSTTAELEGAYQACLGTLSVRLMTPAIEMFDVDLRRMEQTSQENPNTVLKVRREGPEVKAKPAEKEKPVKSPRKPTKPSDIKERSVPGHTDLRHSEAPLVSVGTGEEEEEEGEGDEEEASLTRGRKGKEKAATATSKTTAARKKTIVVSNEDNEGDEAAGEAMKFKPACAFPEWTQRDLDEELFFYPDDIAYTDPDGQLMLVPEQANKFSSWMRLSSFIAQPKMLIGEGLSPYAVTQSNILGDCAFLATLAAGANHKLKFGKDILGPSVHPQNEKGLPVYNPSGKYAFRFFWNGALRKVVVDDFFPLDMDGRPLCTFSTNKSEVFASLIEKAYMKVKGGAYIHGTHAASDMQILFGFAPEAVSLIDLVADSRKTDHLWTKLEKGFSEAKCLVVFATGGLAESDLDPAIPSFYRTSHPTGLLPFHAYACLDIRCTRDGQRLVKLKNPWAAHRWRGKWSEHDAESWTEEVQQDLDFDLSAQHYFDNGVFWIGWEDLLEYYSELHIGWDPEACYADQRIAHAVIPALPRLTEKAATLIDSPFHDSRLHQLDGLVVTSMKVDLYIDPRSYVHSPQYVLTVAPPPHRTSVHLVLTRHHTGATHHVTSRKGSVDSYKTDDYMTLHIFENGGKRINDIYDGRNVMVHEGRFVTGDNYFVQLDLEPGPKSRTFTVLVCHKEAHSAFPFSLRLFAPPGAEVDRFALLPKDHWAHEQQIQGSWDPHKKVEGTEAHETTVGGPFGLDTYLLNPMYLVSFRPSHSAAHVRFQATLSAYDSARGGEVNVNLALLRAAKDHPTDRSHYLNKQPPITTTGPYRPDYCALTHTLSMKESGGDVVVVVSTQPGCAASFTLTVQANDSAEGIAITPIPSLGEGMAVTAFEGVWHPDDAGRQGGPLDNPRLEFRTTDKTHLYAYVTTAMGGGDDDGEEAFAMMERRGGRLGPVAVRLCLYHHKKKKTLPSGPFSDNRLRVLTPTKPLKAGEHLSVVAVTSEPPPHPIAFTILLFSTAPLAST